MATVSSAFVKVRPELQGFGAELRAKLNSALGEAGVKVRVSPDLTGFKTKLAAELRAREFSIKVKVEPDMAGFDSALRRALETAMNNADRRGEEFGRRFGEGARRGADGGLDNLGNGAGGSNGNNNDDGLNRQTRDSDRFSNSLRNAAEGTRQLGRGLTRIGVINSLALAAGQAVQLAIALAPIAGILAAIPAAASIAGASIGTIAIGFSGIGDALTTTAKVTGAAVSNTISQQRAVEDAVRGVSLAQRGLVDANKDVDRSQRDVADATKAVDDAYQAIKDTFRETQVAQDRVAKSQKALNEAREQASRRLEEYKDQLRDAALSEESANVALIEAQDDYQTLLDRGITKEVDLRKARLAVAEAEARVTDAVENTAKVQTDAEVARKAGVDGSKEVQDAQDNLTDSYYDAEKAQRRLIDANKAVDTATRNVADAQDKVADANQRVLDAQDEIAQANQRVADTQLALAQASAGGAAALDKQAQAMAKLSPEAQKLVRALIGLKPSFDSLRKSVQDSLFRGLDDSVTSLASTSLPTFRTGLTEVADAFNDLFLRSSAVAQSPFFQNNLATVFKATATFGQQLASAIPPLIDGLLNLAAAGAPVVLQLTGLATEAAKTFGEFLATEEGANKMRGAMDRALGTLSELYKIAKNVGGIIGSIFSAGSDAGFLENIERATGKLNEFLKTPEGKEDLQVLFEALKNSSEAMAGVIGTVAKAVVSILKGINSMPQGARDFLYQFFAWSIVLGPVISTVSAFVSAVVGLGIALGGISAFALAVAAAVAIFVVGVGVAAYLIATHWDAIKNKTQEAFNAVKDIVLGVADAIKNAFSDPTGFLREHGTDILRGLVAGLTLGLSELVVFMFNKLPSSLIDPFKRALGINSPSTVFAELGQNIIQGLINGIVGFLGNLASAVGSIPRTLVDALGNLYQQMEAYGQNIVIGLINGVAKQGDKFVNALKDLGNRAKEKFADVFKINSPSKVFYGFGTNIIDGLVLGLTGSLGDVQKAMDRVTGVTNIDDALAYSGSGSSAGYATGGTKIEKTINVYNNITPASPTSWTDEVVKADQLDVQLSVVGQ